MQPRRRPLLEHLSLSKHIIGLAIEVHRGTGTGLLESVYATCLCCELEQAGIPVQRQVGIPVVYGGLKKPMGFRADILVADTVIVEVKGVSALTIAHEHQLQTYLRMGGLPLGFLVNFHAPRLKDGLRRFVNARGLVEAA